MHNVHHHALGQQESLRNRRRHKSGDQLQRVKPLSLHFGLLIFIFVYAFVGGLIMTKIENNAAKERDLELEKTQMECVARVSP